MIGLACEMEISRIKEIIKQSGQYEQLVKSKQKEIKLQLIKKDDLIESFDKFLEGQIPVGEAFEEVKDYLCLSQEHRDVFQVKMIIKMMDEVI